MLWGLEIVAWLQALQDEVVKLQEELQRFGVTIAEQRAGDEENHKRVQVGSYSCHSSHAHSSVCCS